MKFYIIDDDVESVFEIVNTACRRLWKTMDNLQLVVAFCGDDYKKTPSIKDADSEEFNRIQADFQEIFHEVCFAIDREEWLPLGTTYGQKKQHTTIECKSLSMREPEIEKQVSAWKEIQVSEIDKGQKKEYNILSNNTLPDELVKQLEIQKEDLVALDICLLYDDYERCIHKLPVLSLALYKHLVDNVGCKCFLYSRMSVNTEAKSNWMELYKEHFDTDPPEIHSRFNLSIATSSTYRELETLLTTKNTECRKEAIENES